MGAAMTISPSPPYTVTPVPGQTVDCSGTSLEWPAIPATATRSLWLDASLELAAVQPPGTVAVSITAFSNEIIYGDDALTVTDATTLGSAYGFLASGGTPNIYYAMRITADLSDTQVLTWDVALPITGEPAYIPPLPPGPPTQFGAEYNAWFITLPNTMPEGPGQYWNNGGILAQTAIEA